MPRSHPPKSLVVVHGWCVVVRRLYGQEADDATLPEIHTCTRELHLPNYSNARVLKTKLLLALEHATDGFQKE